MSPAEFTARFRASLPEVPPELGLKFDEFVQFPASAVAQLRIGAADKEFLTVSGLPRDAAPFLCFGLSGGRILGSVNYERGSPSDRDRFKMIGHNGSGDMVCIDDADGGAVVYLNHDRNMEVVFMNSCVTKLAESLCIFAEFMIDKDGDACRRAISALDARAMDGQSFWPDAILCEETAG